MEKNGIGDVINRRDFIAAGAAVGVGALAPATGWTKQTLEIGARTLTTLSDGNLTLPASFMFGPMDKAALPEVLKPFGMAPDGQLTPPCNLTLLKDGERTVLFDAGAGPSFQPSAGKLADALEAAGLSPDDVTHVVFTHGHPDHLWGVLDDFDEPVFINATHMMGQVEFDYWRADDTVNTIGEARASFAVGAKRRLDTLADKMTLFKDGEEILPGVAARMTPGHTPGHMSFEVRDGSEAALIGGDAIGNHHVAFARPDWRSGSDQDPDLAVKTRVALMSSLSADKTRLIGFHLPKGGVGHVEAKDGAYRFAPLDA